MRIRNQELILRHLELGPPISQKDLAQQTGLSEATVSNLVAVLTESGDIVVSPGMRNGRRANLLSRSARSRGIDVGVQVSRRWIRVDGLLADGSVVRGRSAPRPVGGNYSDDLPMIEALIDELVTSSEGERVLRSVGVGLGVTVDPTVGRLAGSYEAVVPGFGNSWRDADLGADLSSHYQVPAIVLNDCDSAALAEARQGAASGESDILYVHLGYGVGGGLVLNGQLYRGGRGGYAAEIGHMSGDPNGKLCICGNRGCLEMLFGDALLASVAEVHGSDLSLAEFARLARAGDPACVRVLTEVAEPLAAGLANPIAVVTPARVVIGGPLAEAGDALLRPLVEAMNRGGGRQFWRGDVALTTLGDDNVCIGAALAARELSLAEA